MAMVSACREKDAWAAMMPTHTENGIPSGSSAAGNRAYSGRWWIAIGIVLREHAQVSEEHGQEHQQREPCTRSNAHE